MAHSKHHSPFPENQARDPFFDDCFSFDIPNKFEKRNWSKIDEFKGVPDLVKKGDYDKAWFILDHISDQYSDYDFIYAWKAEILQKKEDHTAAREILTRGLKKARSTHLLCERMGYLKFESGDINEAVMWWIRSVVLMSRPNAAKRWEALLYLAYIAKACGCVSNHKMLMTIVSRISIHGRLELESETIIELEKNVPNLTEKPIIKALDHLCVYYLKDQIQPKASITAKNDISGDQSNANQIKPNQIESNQIEPNRIGPNRIEPNLVNWDKKVFWYIGLGIFFVVLIFFSYFYFNSDEPLNSRPDKVLSSSNIDENSKQDVSIETAVKQDTSSIPTSVAEKISSREKIESKKTQIPDQTNPSPIGKVDKSVSIPGELESTLSKGTNTKSTELKKTASQIDHKRRYQGLKLKTKTPKPVRIKKDKQEN